MKYFRLWPQQRSVIFSVFISLFLLSMPVSAVGSGHGYSGGHGEYSHKDMGAKGHGYGRSRHSSSRHGYGRHMGPHQSASQFIQHILYLP